MAEETAEVSLRRLEQVGCQQRLPGTDEEAAKVEELLAEELANLSMSEQDVASFEVHGIAAEVEETPELVYQCLIELEEEVQKIKINKKPAYEKALKMNPTYVTSQSFRLQFLRCEAFNCKNAAGRLVLHFQQKEQLFGSGDVLVRDVRMSDMDSSGLKALESGALQLLPTCDVSGRAVLLLFLRKWGDKPKAKTAQRMLYYMMQTAMQDENMQRKGIVVILYFVGNDASLFGFNIFKSVFQTRLAVPHRLEAMHICYDSKTLRPIVSGLRFFLDKRGRTRSRIHFGNEKHLLFQLQTYGIPIAEDSPLKRVNGELPLAPHREWLQIRQAQEMKVSGTGEIPKTLFPHRFDVLFGRGTKVRSHTGNLRALQLVNMWQSRYDGASYRAVKAEISERIVSIIHQSKGRFLKWEETGWVEVDDEAARDKVAHYFRNQRRIKSDHDTNKQSTAPKRTRSTEIAVQVI
ncbi:unnamed protein product [Cylindrotheca closterium]|uniref:CRAL-TRIO domain-containing protein n=1 Tax=Cylindrotheca closterium TaxID=2856 RepID=A0AAD2FSJ9_9STRA|nr:unnamed protein product [Cylindrotheca closterium]